MSSGPLLAAALVVFALASVAAHAGAASQVVIESDRLEPRWLETRTGERVTFVNRTGRPVHLQFSGDPRQHEVIQIPVTGPVWAVFHRPGTHPYVVHVYDHGTRGLEGTVNVTIDETHQWLRGTCDVVVEGNCIVP